MPTAMAQQIRCRTLVVKVCVNVGWPLPRLNHPWPPSTMARSSEFMVTLFFILVFVFARFQNVLDFGSLSTQRCACCFGEKGVHRNQYHLYEIFITIFYVRQVDMYRWSERKVLAFIDIIMREIIFLLALSRGILGEKPFLFTLTQMCGRRRLPQTTSSSMVALDLKSKID